MKNCNFILKQNIFDLGYTIQTKDEEIKRLKDENKYNLQNMLEANAIIEVKDNEIKILKDRLDKVRVLLKKNIHRIENQKNKEIKNLKEKLANSKSVLAKSKDRAENQKIEENKWQYQSSTAMDNQIKFRFPPVENKERVKSQLADQQSSHHFIQPDIVAAIWICNKCSNENQISSDWCSMCFFIKPGINGWECEWCSLINSPNNTFCSARKSRKEIERSINSSRESERNTVLNYANDGYTDGYYAITPEWIGDWMDYTKGGQSPGRLITSNFFDSKGSLKQGLKILHDYRMINKSQWEYLYSIYGGDSPLVCSSFDIYSLKSGGVSFQNYSTINSGRNTGENWNSPSQSKRK